MQELISRGAQMEAHIDDVCLGTNTQEDHLILLGEFFAVCQENHTQLNLEKCEFMQETMQYLGFDVGYRWWTPAASKAKPLMDSKGAVARRVGRVAPPPPPPMPVDGRGPPAVRG